MYNISHNLSILYYTVDQLNESAVVGITVTVLSGTTVFCCCCIISALSICYCCLREPSKRNETSSVMDDVISNLDTTVTIMPEGETETPQSELAEEPPPEFNAESLSQYKTVKPDGMKREESLPTYDSLFTNSQYCAKSSLKPEPIMLSAIYQPPIELPPLPHAVEQLPPITKEPPPPDSDDLQ